MNIADKCVCINLKSRKDKKKYMKILCRRKKIPIKYYLAEKHENTIKQISIIFDVVFIK